MSIRSEFSVHMLNEEGKEKARAIAAEFSTLLDRLEALCGPGSREMALTKTHLQDAAFWAKRAMAVQLVNQAPPETP